MDEYPLIAASVSQETKNRLRAIAQARQISESALLKRLVENALFQAVGVAEETVVAPIEPVARGARLYVRLRPEDHLLLRERATGRGMAAATYASFLLRAHLRSVTPMPDRELGELRRVVGALSAVGRNLNQLTRAANQGRVTGPSGADFRQYLRICEALRELVKGIVTANGKSGDGQ
jgi:mobilization protein NikA